METPQAISGVKVQLLKRKNVNRGVVYDVYYMNIPVKVVRALGLKEKDVFSLNVKTRGRKVFLVFELLK